MRKLNKNKRCGTFWKLNRVTSLSPSFQAALLKLMFPKVSCIDFIQCKCSSLLVQNSLKSKGTCGFSYSNTLEHKLIKTLASALKIAETQFFCLMFVFYFSLLEFLSQLFRVEGYEEVVNEYVHRETVNRKEDLRVPRVFLQSKFQKPFSKT